MNPATTKPFAITLDTETTGTDPHEARLVTAYIGLVDDQGDVILEQDFLVNPGVEIPEGAQAVHGISTEYAARHGQNPADALADIFAILQDTAHLPLVIYNAPYDTTVLLAEARRHASAEAAAAFDTLLRGFKVIDPLVLDKGLDKWRRGSRKLIDTAAHYGVALSEEDAHGASADALAAARVALAIFQRFPRYAPPHLSWELLHEWQKDQKAEQSHSFQDWLRTKAPADRRDPEAIVSGDWPIQEKRGHD